MVSRGSDGAHEVSLHPKHDDGPPITLTGEVSVPADAEHDAVRDALHDAIRFGGSVDLPGEYLHAFRVDGPPELNLASSADRIALLRIIALPEEIAVPVTATVTSTAGLPLARLRFTLTSRTTGTAGIRAAGWDAARTAKMTMTVERLTRTVSVTISGNDDTGPVLPSVLVPTLRFFAASHTPNAVQIAVDGTPHGASIPFEKEPSGPMGQITAAAEDLAAIQDSLQDPFPVPALDPKLADRLARLRRLLEGELVLWERGTLNAHPEPENVPTCPS